MRRTLVILAALALTALVGSSAYSARKPTRGGTSGGGPVVVVAFENKDAADITPAAAPYLTSFAQDGVVFTNFYAITYRGSLPNYLDVTSGSDQGCSTDVCARASVSGPSIFSQLDDAGLSWRTLAEGMSDPCQMNNDPQTHYLVRHNPPPYYADLVGSGSCASNDIPFQANATSTFTFVVPNACNDMHDGPLQGCAVPSRCSSFSGKAQKVCFGDVWASQHIPDLLATGAEVVVWFDEGRSAAGGNRIWVAAEGGGYQAGSTDGTHYDHFSLLAGIEDHFGLGRLGQAKGATPLPIP
jgi:phosphatidylinositol-3-phosphatase